MEWIGKRMDRLFELYEQYVERLQSDAVAVNRSLGSSHPRRTWLKPLTRRQFEAFLTDEPAEYEVRRLWMLRIVRGHEQEFPELRATTAPSTSQSPGRQSPLGSHRRARGA